MNSPIHYQFSEVPQPVWASQLAEIKKSGQDRIQSFLLWGNHSREPGQFDFSKSPKARIEAFFKECQDQGLELDLWVGFPAGDQPILPRWFENATQGLFHEKILDSTHTPFVLRSYPSPFSFAVYEGFTRFVQEISDIVRLHLSPGGAVRSLKFFPGLMRVDQNCLNALELFKEPLKQRYSHVDEVNLLYQTSFREVIDAFKPTGFSTLLNKRPLLATFDYQFLRDRQISLFEMGLKPFLLEVKDFAGWLPENEAPKRLTYYDSIAVETDGNQFLPCLPFGHQNKELAEHFNSFSQVSINSEIRHLREVDKMTTERGMSKVYCAKIMSLENYARLKKLKQLHWELEFIPAPPKYDEWLRPLNKI